MSRLYSPTTKAFYPADQVDGLPDDVRPVTDARNFELLSAQIAGCSIEPDAGGNPVAVDRRTEAV